MTLWLACEVRMFDSVTAALPAPPRLSTFVDEEQPEQDCVFTPEATEPVHVEM
jgi:hypothetical protein